MAKATRGSSWWLADFKLSNHLFKLLSQFGQHGNQLRFSIGWISWLASLDFALRQSAILLEYCWYVSIFFRAWWAVLMWPNQQSAYLQLYFQYLLQYRLLGISYFSFNKESPWPKTLLFTALVTLTYLNIIGVLKIILRRLSRSMMSGFQDSTVFFDLT